MSKSKKAAPVLVIPAYEPAETLPGLMRRFARLFSHIIVVNDGSSQGCSEIFEKIGRLKDVTLLEHDVNLGKGAALKTAFNYFLLYYPHACGVVTMDADGQHRPEDVKRIARALEASPATMCLGARKFSEEMPWKSRIGNLAMRGLFRFFTKFKLNDTQTGLRGIPRDLVCSLVRLKPFGYDFELEMLFEAGENGVPIVEMPIETVYFDRNRHSSFNPVVDSAKIYAVFVRNFLRTLIS